MPKNPLFHIRVGFHVFCGESLSSAFLILKMCRCSKPNFNRIHLCKDDDQLDKLTKTLEFRISTAIIPNLGSIMEFL